MYADMYNRAYEGGGGSEDERVHVGGVPVDKILEKRDGNLEQEGGKGPSNSNRECRGPLANKVVPAGLVLIHIRREPDVEYEDHFHPGMNREVVPESLYDRLMGSVIVEKHRNRTPPKKTRKDRSRRRRKVEDENPDGRRPVGFLSVRKRNAEVSPTEEEIRRSLK
jgi:hypothetical protein